MDSTDYNPSILRTYADMLYEKAKWIVYQTAFKYAVIAFVLTFVIAIAVVAESRQPGRDPMGTAFVVALFAAGFGALAGVEAGRAKAFALKLQAQLTLCQRQIEMNTHSTAQARAAGLS